MSSPAASGAHRWHQRHRYALAGSMTLLVGALVYIGIVDPHRPDSVFPLCPFRLLTGWNCPACGTLRMIHDLLHGDLAAAINDNVMVLIGVPLLVGWLLLRRGPLTLPTGAVVLVTLAVWTVVRNLPGFSLVPTVITR